MRASTFYKCSHLPLPEDESIQRRIDYVIRISGALHTTYPTNESMGWRWLRQKHRRFGRAPLSVMLDGAEDGLVAVLAELDCPFS